MRFLLDAGLARAADIDIFRVAAEQQRVLVTLDLDFAEIVALSADRIVSTVLLRLTRPTRAGIFARLDVVLPSILPVLTTGAIVVVEDARYRVRRLPIGA